MGRKPVALAAVAALALALAACGSDEESALRRAQADVTAKEKAVADAQTALTEASAAFCDASQSYIAALDRYGDVLRVTTTTVGDVVDAGSDLAAPQAEAFDQAEAAVTAQQTLFTAQQELAQAQATLVGVQSTDGVTPTPTVVPSPGPLAPEATVARVQQAEDDFAAAQGSINDDTPLVQASQQFNAAAVALEISWLRLFADAGCLTDDQAVQAEAAVRSYTAALQQSLTTAGYYEGEIDGVYGPATVDAIEALQTAHGLPVTGTLDKATADALDAEVLEKGGAEAVEELTSTAAVQQTLKLAGFWDGPVDGKWTPELTEALKEFQTELGVEPTGTVDAATITALKDAIAAIQALATPTTTTPTPTPSETTTSAETSATTS